MNDMQAFRLVGRVACQQFPPASHTMDDEWQMQLGGQLHLQLEVVDLFRQGNGASPVESTFSDSGDTRMAGQLCKMPIGCFPWSFIEGKDTGGIQLALSGNKGISAFNNRHGQIDDSIPSGSRLMGMNVRRESIHGTGSYPLPPQGWQRRILLMASHVPFRGPCFLMACMAYWEHVGVKRQEAGV